MLNRTIIRKINYYCVTKTRSWLCSLAMRIRGMQIGKNLILYGPSRLSVSDEGTFIIGDNVQVGNNVMVRVDGTGTIKIEDGVILQDNCSIQCGGNMVIGRNSILVTGVLIYCVGEVNIGEDVLLAGYVVLADAEHSMEKFDTAIRWQGLDPPLPINIGAGAWLGTKVTVTKGITIGAGAVIGANAVVTKSIPPMAIAAGVPAKILKYRTQEKDEG